MKKGVLLVVLTIGLSLNAQELKKRVFWYLPASNTQINGIGAGLTFSSLDFMKADTTKTNVNGLAIELIGMGVIVPLLGKTPLFPVDSNRIYDLLYEPISSNYRINGMAISPGGLFCGATVNGLNLSGIGSITDRINGFTMAIFQSHARVNGLSISLGDEAIRHYGVHIAGWSEIYLLKGLQLGALNDGEITHGLQMGLINKTKKLKGIQIGLWNSNRKRKLPS
jgi:hypothetical protein